MLNNLDQIRESLKTLSDEDFRTKVEGTKTRLAEKDTRHEQTHSRYWSEIATRRYRFDRQEENVRVLETLTKEELLQHFEEKFFLSPRIVEVSVSTQKKKEENSEYQRETLDKIYAERNWTVLNVGDKNLQSMKAGMMLHPDPFKQLISSEDVRL